MGQSDADFARRYSPEHVTCGEEMDSLRRKLAAEQAAHAAAQKQVEQLQRELDEANARDANGREQATKNAGWYAAKLLQEQAAHAATQKQSDQFKRLLQREHYERLAAGATLRADDAEREYQRARRELREEQAAHAATRQERDELLPMTDADAFTIGTLNMQIERLSAALRKVVIIADRCDDAGGEYWQAGLIAKKALEAATPAAPPEPGGGDATARRGCDG